MISSLYLSMISSENRFPLFPDHAPDLGVRFIPRRRERPWPKERV
jgi:hypothetical protein